MGLDARGIIAIVELVAYAPILVTSGILVLRHGFTRRAGWLFLLIFAIVRIVGASIHLASELGDPNNVTLKIIFSILDGAGLSPLLFATIGFLTTIAQQAFDGIPLVHHGMRLLGTLCIVALALTIAGGVQLSNADGDLSKLSSARTLRHVGAILFLVAFIILFFVHLLFWIQRDKIMKHRRQLLIGVSAALPFLLIRLLYAVLSAFSPVTPGTTSALTKFSITTGSWVPYLIMGALAEFLVVLIYTIVGITIPLQQDYQSTSSLALARRWSEEDGRPSMVGNKARMP